MSGTNRKEAGNQFDAPRPTVSNRLGKKRTDELIQADGDTWQEYLAVSEKAHSTTSSNAFKRGGAFSFFGKKNKEKQSSSNAANNNNGNGNGDGSNLIIRSYFQNQRTGKKVWDEPPSGASMTVSASEQMRRMAELQLDELHVVAKHAADIDDLGEHDSATNSRTNDNRKEKKSVGGGLFRWGNNTSGSNAGTTKGETANSGGSINNGTRIRYKPNSKLNTTRNSSASTAGSAASKGRSSNSNKTLNDRQLQEAIERSMSETYGHGVAKSKGNVHNGNGNAESEDDILRRVLEQSRLEASNNNSYNDCDGDRKPAARKHPPTNTVFVKYSNKEVSRQSKIQKDLDGFV